MGRTLSPAAAFENAAFLRHLARTGNAHEAARALGLSRSRFTRRRTRDPAFALRWDAALALAQSALSNPPAQNLRAAKPTTPVILRRANGTAQIRRRLPTAIAPADEARFLSALAATANVRLAARAAGFASASFYARKRRDPAFAREWVRALALAYDRLELALLEGCLPGSDADAHERESWSRNDPPPIPPMTASQAIQLLHLHLKEARMIADPEPLRRRRGESPVARDVRLRLMREAWDDIERAKFDDMQSARRDRGEDPYWSEDITDAEPTDAEPAEAPILPDLAQVTGWSRADPTKTPHDGTRAMFGGWRIADWKKGAG